ncbi:MAG: hypothetical protein ABIA21_03635 [Candidatus Aenigmatarchaeota archaeon]
MNILQKYKPRALQDVIGNTKQIGEVLAFVKSFYSSKKSDAIVVSGPTGTGKTIMLEIISRQLGYELAEYDDVDTTVSSMNQMSMFNKGKIVVLDLDCCTNLRNLGNVTENSRHPVVLVTLDIWNNRYASIRSRYKAVKFYKPNYLSIQTFLKKVCIVEGIGFDDNSLRELAKNSDGDVRSALLVIESLRGIGVSYDGVRMSGKDGVYSIFDVMNSVFYGSVERGKLSSVDPFLLSAFLRNKVAEIYSGEKLVHAMRCLSNADLFKSRIIKRQAWSLEKYWFDFISFIGRS